MTDPIVFPPTTDSGWSEWGQRVIATVTPAPADFGVSPAQLSQFTTLYNAYQTAYLAATTPATRTRPSIAAKDQARADFRVGAASFVNVIKSFPTITNEQLLEVGIKPKAQRQPIPPPAFAPDIDIVSVNGNLVKIRLHNSQTVGRRAKPKGVQGAAVFSYVGTQPPEDPTLYKFEGAVTRSEVDVEFPASVQPGTKVWITAFWYSAKAAFGPGAVPVSAVTQWPMQVAPVAFTGTTRKAA